MTLRWPSSCLSAVSSVTKYRYTRVRIADFQRIQLPHTDRTNTYLRRYYTSQSSPQNDLDRHEKSALVEIEGLKKGDPVNPPRSTVPPPLTLPTRGDENIALYYFRIGRAYGSFYWVGVKAVWFNYKAAKALREQLKKQLGEASEKKASQRNELDFLTRSKFQLLARNNHDIGKLPFFGVLVALFGEWLPVIVPFIPGAVPGTCRIPKQVHGMRAKAEERRRRSFRRGISEPSEELLEPKGTSSGGNAANVEWPLTQKQYAAEILQRLRDDQLFHLSSTLNIHNRLWDFVQLPPPSFLLRSGLSKRLSYLASDDLLLHRYGGLPKLSLDEVRIACEERGLDVLGKREEVIRSELSWWLDRQKEDRGRGHAVFTMLFRRLAIRDWVSLHLNANRDLQAKRLEDENSK